MPFAICHLPFGLTAPCFGNRYPIKLATATATAAAIHHVCYCATVQRMDQQQHRQLQQMSTYKSLTLQPELNEAYIAIAWSTWSGWSTRGISWLV